jgi:hypothetical protein
MAAVLHFTYRGYCHFSHRPQSTPPAAGQGVRLVTTVPASVEFGELAVGERVSQEVTIRNHSAVPLRISDARVSCGCTGVELKERNLPAFGAVVAQVWFDTAGRAGTVQKQIHLAASANLPEAASVVVTLPVSAVVRRDLTTDPEAIDFGSAPVGESRVKTVRLKSNRDINWKILLDPNFGAEWRLETSDSSPREAVVRLRFAPSAAYPETSRMIRIYTGDAISPIVDLPVSYTATSRFELSTAAVHFGAVACDAAETRTLRVAPRNGVAARVTGVDTSDLPDWVRVKHNPDGAAANVEVTTVPGRLVPRRVYQYTLRLTTDHPAERHLSVPISLLTRE